MLIVATTFKQVEKKTKNHMIFCVKSNNNFLVDRAAAAAVAALGRKDTFQKKISNWIGLNRMLVNENY